MEWLFAPIDPGRNHDIDLWVSWHGRLMVLAWCVLFPAGVITARFLKITPSQSWPDQLDNQTWWYLHLAFQYVGTIVVAVALWQILQIQSDYTNAALHHWLGWITIGLCVAQVLAGLGRGSKGGPGDISSQEYISGDHYNMTRRRRLFEYWHKSVGYFVLLLSCATVLTGFWSANAPRWMWLAIVIWWCAIGTTFFLLQRKGLALDTYQAIWGPDSIHPGNKTKPIGWGIKRHQSNR